MSDYPGVLSSLQVEPLLRERKAGRATATTSLDLGLSQVDVALDAEGVVLPGGERLPWEEVERVAGNPSACFAIEDGVAVKIQRFSEVRNRSNVLLPTRRAPTVLISGVQMRRRPLAGHREQDPYHRPRHRPRPRHVHRPGLHGHCRGPDGRRGDHHRAGSGHARGGAPEPLVAAAL
jgi:predicted methyltransferase